MCQFENDCSVPPTPARPDGGRSGGRRRTGSLSARRVAALVLLVEPNYQPPIDPDFVAQTLGLTPAESHIAVWLAEGRTARDIAMTTEREEGTVYWHMKRAYRKLGISRQADLVRRVLSVAELR